MDNQTGSKPESWTRITINLPMDELEAICADAKREYRPARDHARVLMLRSLGIVDSTWKPGAPPKRAAREVVLYAP